MKEELKRKRKKSKTNSSKSRHPLLLESGTEEYQIKKQIEIEKVDLRGIFRRSKVVDQTRFDKLFLEDKITQAQFSAAESYLELMGVAGCFLRSPSMQGSEKITGRDVAGNISSKILVISKARETLRSAGDEALIAVETCLASDKPVDLVQLRSGLDVLVRYFRIV